MGVSSMKKRDIVSLVLAFAMLALLIGIGIMIFSKEQTLLNDIGHLVVILSFIVAAISQIILWIINRKLR